MNPSGGRAGGPAPTLGLSAGFVLGHVVLPLLVGGWIYVAWRAEHLWMFRWFRGLGLQPAVDVVRHTAAPWADSLPDWLLFSVPDGAWVYACVAFFGRLWAEGPAVPRWFWVGLGPFLAIGGEIGQIPGWIPGTFDLNDLLWYSGATLSAVWAAGGFRGAGRWRELQDPGTAPSDATGDGPTESPDRG